MATRGSSSGLTSPVRSHSRPSLSPPPLSKPAAAMSMSPGGSGRAGGRRDANPPPRGVHPRYVPKRGSVLKGIVRGVLRCFVPASPANTGGRRVRVRPAPAEAGGDDPVQGEVSSRGVGTVHPSTAPVGSATA